MLSKKEKQEGINYQIALIKQDNVKERKKRTFISNRKR